MPEMEDAIGRCFELSSRYVMFEGADKDRLVQAVVVSGDGMAMIHAWVEVATDDPAIADRFALDPTMPLGRLGLSADAYERLMRPMMIFRYTRMEALELMLEQGQYGPWAEELWEWSRANEGDLRLRA